jgi:hypothetical protein
MDTYTLATLIPALVLTFIGERFKTGVYTILASMFWILFAWRVAEPGFYIASGATIVVLIFRGVYSHSESNTERAASTPTSKERKTHVA